MPASTNELLPFDINDGGLISDIPCGPPCFFGSTPGISTADDVLSNLSKFGIPSFCHRDVPWINCPVLNFLFNFRPDSDIINWIEFRPNNVPLGSLIEKYGNPSNWYLDFPTDESGYSLERVSLWIYYEEMNTLLVLEHQERIDGIYFVTSESKVFLANYYDNTWFDDSYPMEWHGYGNYQLP